MFSNIIAGAAGFPVADLGDEISQSLRFHSGANLTRNLETAFPGSFSATGTCSAWWKFANSLSDSTQSVAWRADNLGGSDRGMILGKDGFIKVRCSGGDVDIGGKYRDYSGWYHIVQQSDGTNLKVWVNGDLKYNATNPWESGSNSNNDNWDIKTGNETGNEFNFYLAEFNFLDGTALDADEFGRYNDDGVWVPTALSFTAAQYGSNGFRLTFDSSQTNAGIAEDSAPIGASGHTARNDFTASGFDTAAISSSNTDNDVDYLDTPTSNYATFNSVHTDTAGNATMEEGNLFLSATTGSAHYIDARSTIPASECNCYVEMAVRTKSGSNALIGIGVGDHESQISSGTGAYVCYRQHGNVIEYPGNTTLGTESSYDEDDVIGMTVNSTQVAFYKNGTLEGTYDHGLTGDFFVIGMAYDNGHDSEVEFNFGQRDFIHTIPTGFSALQINNLSEPTIKNGKEHFDVVTYEGNTSSPPTITGLDFQPDLIWIKITSTTSNHSLYDSIRGATKVICSSSNSAEETDGEITPTSDGFTVGSDNSIIGSTNSNGHDYVAWCWKAGGTAETNDDGTRTSSVSANTDAGFSIVSFDGTDGDTIGHGLSERPEFILDKDLEDSQLWRVFHYMMDDGDINWDVSDNLHLDLNDEYPAARGAATRIDQVRDTFFRISGGNAGNARIAYCWHSVEGFSKFGTYEGNGSTDGTFVYLGFKPSLVIFKNVDAEGSWVMYDTTRNEHNPCDNRLTANTNNSTGTSSSMHVDFLSNGFKHRNNDQDLNSSHTFIYMAWAENPFGGENAAPATAR